ncbi:MAG: hypothetical protein DYG86_17185 [Chloroflexi bacterium CFX2]|nr:hypothetical protein [Chloroflexi bacterium CFX2]
MTAFVDGLPKFCLNCDLLLHAWIGSSRFINPLDLILLDKRHMKRHSVLIKYCWIALILVEFFHPHVGQSETLIAPGC